MNDYLSNLVKCFNNQNLGVNLTTILIDNEPWFIAKEVASILKYTNLKKAINRNVNEADQRMLSYEECKELFGNSLDIEEDIEVTESIENTEDFRGALDCPPENTMKVNPFGVKIINESGLYDLILEAKKKEAKAFRRWVTSEVLPSIRKTGSYGIAISEEDRLKLNVLNAEDAESRFIALNELEQYRAKQRKMLEDQNKALNSHLEVVKSTMFTNKRICEMIKDKFNIKYADSTLKRKTSKALQVIANELQENILYDREFVDGVMRSIPYYTPRTYEVLVQRLETDNKYLKQY